MEKKCPYNKIQKSKNKFHKSKAFSRIIMHIKDEYMQKVIFHAHYFKQTKKMHRPKFLSYSRHKS